MSLSADISTALHLLEHVQERVDGDDPKLQMHAAQDLKSLISLLEDPVFRSIVTIQDSLIELNTQLGQHPSILPGDFDINIGGQLELSVPTTPVQPLGPSMYQDLYQDSSELEDQRVPVAPLIHSSSEDTSAQVTSPSLTSEVMGMPPITTPTYAKEFKKVIEAAARGRQIFTVQLYKPEGTSLGFSVVGLRSKDKGELGIFLQEIQPNGIAGCDGRLVEGDQILAIDGQPLDSNISHEQAISILQKARGLVELVVARSAQDLGSSLPTDELSGGSSSTAAAAASVLAGAPGGQSHGNSNNNNNTGSSLANPGSSSNNSNNQAAGSDKEQSVSVCSSAPTPGGGGTTATPSATPTQTPTPTPASTPVPAALVVERSPSAVSDASKSGSDMVLNTEWAQVEVINLINDGSGLGFGIIGGRSTGVVVKTILPGGVADRDNRLQSGDHILQIGDVNLRGMGSEQVAQVLRHSGTHVRLVVARPVEPTSPNYQALGSHAPIVPTKILCDPDELERHLVHSVPETYNLRHVQGEPSYDNGYMYSQETDIEMHARPGLIMDVVRNPMPIGTTMPVMAPVPVPVQMPELPVLTMDTIDVDSLPEMERFTVELKKDIYGLGITIAGYVCEKEELSGIFVKSISEGSAADLSNKIQINDRIVEVDGHSLQGYSNHEAVEVLRRTGQTVVLCLERYLRGPKYEQLQQAIAASELRLPQPNSPSITSLPSFPISADGETTTEIEPEGESHTTVDSAVLQEVDTERPTEDLDDAANVEALLSDPSSELTPQIRAAIKAKWQKIVGPDTEIVVAQLKKFAEGSGLGISLEGTVDVENGQEVRPHHYIRSILPEGPVGQNGTLRSGDELLEVNGYRLLGINHMEVVSVLKELPIHVRMVCGRNIASQDPLCPIDTAQHQAAFQTRSILGGSLQNLLPTMDRLVKAKSDGSLASTTTTATVTDASLNKMKSRSLEPLTGLAMWSSEPQIIELVKGERGLGFSILDYQDPMNPNETVIVIRSLVPGGVAQVDGQLIPGDRLLFVNDIGLENATLDQAVQALKGAPKGTVRIGVAKPLPIPDSIVQRVPPICPVRRSKSVPNESESDRPIEIEELLSSRSGATELSTDKPEVGGAQQAQDEEDEEEEEDHWKDASALTPVCSPSRRPSKLALQPASSLTSREGHRIAVEVDVHEGTGGVPRTPLEEESLISEGSTVMDTRRTSRRSPVKVEKVAPKVKLKPDQPPSCESDESSGMVAKEKDRKRRARRAPRSDRDKDEEVTRWPKDEEVGRRSKEERKSLKEQECIERVTEFLARHSDLGFQEPELDLEEPTGDLERPRPARPATLASLDQASRLAEASRPIRRRDSLKGTSLEEEGQAKVTSRSLFDGFAGPKSLLDGSEARRVLLDGSEATRSPEAIGSESAKGPLDGSDPVRSETKKSPLDGSGAKRSPLESSDNVRSKTKKMSTMDGSEVTKSPLDGSEPIKSETKRTPTLEVSDASLRPRIQGQEVKDATEARGAKLAQPEPETRRSSLRKRTFSRESSRESLLDEAKKEVRIQEDVQEIFFEEVSDLASVLLPEVQLVKARILTAEELSRCRTDEAAEVRGPPEVAVVPGATRVRVTRVPSPEAVDTSQLQLPVLAKSTSENALIEAKDENRVSERNIKPEILLDLSKVTAVAQPEPEVERKGLSRTGSEGSKRFGKGFKVGCLAKPDEPELMVLVEVSKRGSGTRIEPDVLSWREGVSLRSEDSEAEQPGSEFEREQDEGPSVGSEDDYERIPLRQQRARLLGDEGLKDEPSTFKVDQPGGAPLDLSLKEDASAFKFDQAAVPLDLSLKDEPSSAFKVDQGWFKEEGPAAFEDELIRREHSLEYQSQTLESQADLAPVTGKVKARLRDQDLGEEDEEEEEEVKFKGTQISPKERRDAETQTEQVTKSTQCGTSEEPTPEPSPDFPSRSFRVESRSHQSPRREVQTQTQGESKSVQCSLEDLTLRSEPQDSPSRSKSVQCAPEDIKDEAKVEPEAGGSRREVEVQTYQESKAVQCCEEDELLDREWTGSERLSTSSRRSESSVSEAILFVEEPRMTVTQREPGNDGGVAWAKHWGPERLVEIHREPKTSLGLSIVGGKVDLHNGSSSKSQNISGIFIKNVLPNSPAGRTGELKIGDRIIEVDGVDLRQSSHERAVEVIQAAGNPVCLLVQSLVHLQESKPETVDGEAATGSRGEGRRQSVRSRLPAPGTPTASFRQKPVSPARSITPEVIQGGTESEGGPSRSDVRRQSTRSTDGAGPSARRSSMKRSMRKKAPSPPSNPGVLRQVSEEREDHAPQPEAPPRRKYSSDESSEEEDTRELEGNVYTKAGIEISRKSAGNVKRTKQEIEADPEQEDEFGYTSMKVQKKYHGLGHKVLMVKIEKDRLGLGISLAGHKDRNRMAVFVCGIHPKGAAHKTGELLVGDEILEVNGCVLQGRCHLNASAMIKGMAGPCFKIIVIRRTAAVDNLAVKPLVQFPPMLDEMDQFKEYRGVRRIPVKKGQYGLGIMIIEGKHAEVGQGIFISDIQEGSAAEQAGLNVGDMILAVNMDCLLGSTYDEATSLLKKAEGVVTLTVCNPNQSKLAKEEEDRAKGIIPQEEKPAPKEPEKPKEPEPPQDPKDCKIQVGRDTTIEFQKDKDKGIGFTIAGGSDTPSNGVFILEVFPDGAAGKDGRLQAGDQILDFCNQSFKAIEHDKAHAAVLKASGTIVMVVHRQEKPIEEVDVELQKKSGKGAGLCLTGYKSGKGAYVSDLLPGGSALESGKISKGDQVVGVGGQDVREAPVEDIAVHVKVSNPVQLKLARYKSAKQ